MPKNFYIGLLISDENSRAVWCSQRFKVHREAFSTVIDRFSQSVIELFSFPFAQTRGVFFQAILLFNKVNHRGGIEDTRLEAKAKDTKKFRGQGQTLSRPRPRTKDTDASVLKKKSSKVFFQAISTWGKQKKVFADFPQGLWRFPTKFQRFKNSAVLKPRTGQFSRTWGFEAKANDYKMCPRG